MKEALSVIASAWSCACILTFIGMCTLLHDPVSNTNELFAPVFFWMMAFAITGAGWLWYRAANKPDCEDESEAADE